MSKDAISLSDGLWQPDLRILGQGRDGRIVGNFEDVKLVWEKVALGLVKIAL